MVVMSGSATIRFGVADTIRNPQLDGYGRANTEDELHASTYGNQHERFTHDLNTDVKAKVKNGVIEIPAKAGDVFVLPAGVAHKTFDTAPSADFALLTPGDGHHVLSKDAREGDIVRALEEVKLEGFTMMGSYPADREFEWDFAVGGEDKGREEEVWRVKRPGRDPVLGGAEEGLCTTWKLDGGGELKAKL
jgi:uncharacterized protein YjlB